MGRTFFWRSALKAFFVFFFVFWVVSNFVLLAGIVDIIFYATGVLDKVPDVQLLSFFLLYIFFGGSVFSVLFAYLYELIPFKKTLVKFFLFNFAVLLITGGNSLALRAYPSMEISLAPLAAFS